MKLFNMISHNRKVANQFVIESKEGLFFQSYDTIICKIINNEIILDINYECSRTTMKYLCMFLRNYSRQNINSISQVRRNIKNGVYKIADLNEIS